VVSNLSKSARNFEYLVESVISQQLAVKAADTIYKLSEEITPAELEKKERNFGLTEAWWVGKSKLLEVNFESLKTHFSSESLIG
jgi:3-methyladenine DNA glycosylase/8-oxoguanine DNA glycosylase